MRVTYDYEADAIYIYIAEEIRPGGVKATHVCDLSDIELSYGLAPIKGMINLDFDEEGRLLGVEIVGASHILKKDFLEHVES